MTASKTYRKLTAAEIEALKVRGCTAEDWGRVQVTEGFRPAALTAVAFSGDVRLGKFEGEVTLPGGLRRPAGVSRAALHDCALGDGVYVDNIGVGVSGYDLADGVVISNVGLLAVEGETSFGNGIELETLNEGGGREVKIFDRLSSQFAYMTALYRDQPALQEKLDAFVSAYVEKVKSTRGTVGKNARLVGCGTLKNVRIGPAARLEGVVKLVEGSINSNPAAPTVVGDGVQAEGFIFSSGAKVDGGAILSNCFIGQGVKIGRQYSAENSLFFANCEGFHGEACSIFAGPYTVTHHKSTLLIAGLFSFYNAGSGSNQSNHMYKLGPVHQGLLERGSKTGSFSYLLWSCRVGAFTAVIGKHYSKFDTSEFPFSYIMEGGGGSVLVPAANLFTVGTTRDGGKWPDRDRRKDPDKLDLLHFAVLSPYTVGKMIAGRDLLAKLDAEAPADAKYVEHNGVKLSRARLGKGRDGYALGVKLYLGTQVAARLEKFMEQGGAVRDFPAEIRNADRDGVGRWLDVCGLTAPASAVKKLLADVTGGAIGSLEALEAALRELHGKYEELEWGWVTDVWAGELGKKAADVTLDDVAVAVRGWKEAARKNNDLILKDAGKEFGDSVRIGFGIDGGSEAAAADFEAVRGTFEGNKFVKGLRKESEETEARADKLLEALSKATK